MEKVIVNVAPTSNFHGKDANPALPFTPQETADAVFGRRNCASDVADGFGRNPQRVPPAR